ncbi:MAG: hypothetical protein C0487_16865 [Leptothrix sp. (in: Bacteria)]|nr:hypothetical protein [Leptothrix sp. (in: b-proteobacteria)]
MQADDLGQGRAQGALLDQAHGLDPLLMGARVRAQQGELLVPKKAQVHLGIKALGGTADDQPPTPAQCLDADLPGRGAHMVKHHVDPLAVRDAARLPRHVVQVTADDVIGPERLAELGLALTGGHGDGHCP